MKKLFLLTILLGLLAQTSWPQGELISKLDLLVHENQRTGKRAILLPNKLVPKLPSIQVMVGFEAPFRIPGTGIDKRGLNGSVVRVSEYLESKSKKHPNGDRVFGPFVSHREWFPSIKYEAANYIFTGHDLFLDVTVFNKFLSDANVSIDKKDEAIRTAHLFLTSAGGYFEDNGRLILSQIDDVQNTTALSAEQRLKMYRFLNPPTIAKIGNTFEIEIYTWDARANTVIRWNFSIFDGRRIDVQKTAVN